MVLVGIGDVTLFKNNSDLQEISKSNPVHYFNDGEEAFTYIKRRPVHQIVMESSTGLRDRIAIMQKLRRRGFYQPIALISGPVNLKIKQVMKSLKVDIISEAQLEEYMANAVEASKSKGLKGRKVGPQREITRKGVEKMSSSNFAEQRALKLKGKKDRMKSDIERTGIEKHDTEAKEIERSGIEKSNGEVKEIERQGIEKREAVEVQRQGIEKGDENAGSSSNLEEEASQDLDLSGIEEDQQVESVPGDNSIENEEGGDIELQGLAEDEAGVIGKEENLEGRSKTEGTSEQEDGEVAFDERFFKEKEASVTTDLQLKGKEDSPASEIDKAGIEESDQSGDIQRQGIEEENVSGAAGREKGAKKNTAKQEDLTKAILSYGPQASSVGNLKASGTNSAGNSGSPEQSKKSRSMMIFRKDDGPKKQESPKEMLNRIPDEEESAKIKNDGLPKGFNSCYYINSYDQDFPSLYMVYYKGYAKVVFMGDLAYGQRKRIKSLLEKSFSGGRSVTGFKFIGNTTFDAKVLGYIAKLSNKLRKAGKTLCYYNCDGEISNHIQNSKIGKITPIFENEASFDTFAKAYRPPVH